MNIRYLIFLASLFLGMLYSSSIKAEEEIVRDIILINGVAELVDITYSGDIIERHVVIQDYFSSGRSHDKSLKQGLDKLKIFGNVDSEKEERIVYNNPVECRQSLMIKDSRQNINDFSMIDFDTNDLDTSIASDTQDFIGSLFSEASASIFSASNTVIEKQRLGLSVRWYGTEQVLTTSYKTSKASNDV